MEDIASCRLHYMSLTREHLDLALLAKIEAGICMDPLTHRSRQKQTQREQHRVLYFHRGHEVCRLFFLHIHGISATRLKNLFKQFKESGVQERVHGSAKRLPPNTLSFTDTEYVFNFILNIAETQAIILPGRTPFAWKSDCKLLPTDMSKRVVYDRYTAALQESNRRIVSYRSFRRIWQTLLPFVRSQKPATDLCWYCQQRSIQLQRCINQPDRQKSAAAQEMMVHLEQAAKERSLYNSVVEEVRRSLPPDSALMPNSPCSYDGKSHYSFDFAQQVHYPCNPQQPGPIFFKTPRKCGLFGISAEGVKKQVNFVIDESWAFGKGANSVVSMLHFFFEHYGLGEKIVHLHADNCCGQNKNNTMLQYLLWRVQVGLHNHVTLSFLLAGHTKFSPDWGFGLIKRLYRKTNVNCLRDIVNVVEKSAPDVNIAQLCSNQQGDIIVPVYDWTTFLGNFFNKLPGLLKYHHFYFQSDSTVIRCSEFSDSEIQIFDLLKSRSPNIDLSLMPEAIRSTGLDLKRRWYLYKEIRPFVEDDFKDLVAPRPEEMLAEEEEEALEPAQKKERIEKPKGKWKGKGKGKKTG